MNSLLWQLRKSKQFKKGNTDYFSRRREKLFKDWPLLAQLQLVQKLANT
jgi:hypothetical protein